MGFSQASSNQSTVTQQTDKRLTTYNGDILNLDSAVLNAGGGSYNPQPTAGAEPVNRTPFQIRNGIWPKTPGGNSGGVGGTINIVTANADLAKAAIDAVAAIAQSSSTTNADAAQKLAQGSNQIAADVAGSQTQFVATASGQKYVLLALVGVVGVLILPSLFKGGAKPIPVL